MRTSVLAKIPSFTSRIHRPLDANDLVLLHLKDPAVTETRGTKWNWADAEKRLKHAFNKGGLPAWGVAAMREAEEEERALKVPKGHEQVGLEDRDGGT
jgi:hypothetical protein